MNPAEMVREAAMELVKWAQLDKRAHGVSCVPTERIDALRAALALPVEPAKPDELGRARKAVFDAAGTYAVMDLVHHLKHEQGMFVGDEPARIASFREKCEAEDLMDLAVMNYRNVLAAERAAKEPK